MLDASVVQRRAGENVRYVRRHARSSRWMQKPSSPITILAIRPKIQPVRGYRLSNEYRKTIGDVIVPPLEFSG